MDTSAGVRDKWGKQIIYIIELLNKAEQYLLDFGSFSLLSQLPRLLLVNSFIDSLDLLPNIGKGFREFETIHQSKIFGVGITIIIECRVVVWV